MIELMNMLKTFNSEEFKEKVTTAMAAVHAFDDKINGLLLRSVRIESKLDMLLDHAGFDVSQINRDMREVQTAQVAVTTDAGAGHA